VVRRTLQLLIVGVSVLGMVGSSTTAAIADTGWRGPSTAIAPPLPDLPDGQAAGLNPWDSPKALTWRGGAALVAAYSNSEGDPQAVWATSRTSGAGRFETPPRLTDWLIDMEWAARPDGSAVAVGPDYCDDSYYACFLQGRVWRPSTSWRSDGLSIGSATSWAMGSRLDGTATVAWTTPDDEPKGPERLRVATLGPRARFWSRLQDLGPATNAEVSDLDVAADGSSAMLLWKETGRACAAASDGASRTITKLQVRSRSSRSPHWSRPVTVFAACVREDAWRPLHVALAAGNDGKVTVVRGSARGTYFRTRPRSGLPFTGRRKVGAGATDVALRSGADGVMTLAYSAKNMGLITQTQLPHRTTWGQCRRLAAPKDKVVSVDLSTGGRGGAVLGWRQALSKTREEVHVRTKGSGKGRWTKDHALGVAPRTSFADGWVHRGTGRSSIATWFDLNDTVQVSSFG
jgi:hypothetical protein